MAVLTVLPGMTKMSALNRKATVSRGYAVRRPRPDEGVGSALRNAFGTKGSDLPADMCALLRALESGGQKKPA